MLSLLTMTYVDDSFLGHVDTRLDQIDDDRVNVFPVEANLGEFRGLYLDEGGLRQLGHSSSDLGLAASRGSYHEDVLRNHIALEILGQLVATPAVPKSDGDSSFGFWLADDVLIERTHDLLRPER